MGQEEVCSICGREIPERTNVFKMQMEAPYDRHYEDYATLFYVCHKCFASIVMGGLEERGGKDAKISDET